MGTGEDRKRICACGSGKKFKNCCLGKRKKRTIKLSIDPRNLDMMDGLGFSNEGQVFGIKNGFPLPLIGESKIEYGYKKKHKFKILAKGPITSDNMFLNPNISIIEFDHVFAIDTNTETIGQHKVSVAAVLHCIIEPANENGENLKYSFLGCFEYYNVEGKPENLAWMELWKLISNTSGLKQKKIGLLVDSDLGNHESFNNRQHPIYGDFYLPENISILYCSSDGGKEWLINRLIDFCDKKSSEIINYLKSGGFSKINFEDAKVIDKPYSHFRQWSSNDKSKLNTLNLRGLI